MNRKEFIAQLEQLLDNMPQEEKEEALAFYNGYFEDAGEDNEEKIILELESPEKVAQIIKADMGNDDSKEYTEYGYQDQRYINKQEIERTGQEEKEQDKEGDFKSSESEKNTGHRDDRSYSYNKSYRHDEQRRSNSGRSFMIILVAIITCPVWLPLIGSLIGVVIGGVAAVFGLILSMVLAVICFYIISFILIGMGIMDIIFGALATGFAISGIGFVFLALSIFGTVLCVWALGVFTPWFFKAIHRVFSSLFHRGRRGVA